MGTSHTESLYLSSIPFTTIKFKFLFLLIWVLIGYTIVLCIYYMSLRKHTMDNISLSLVHYNTSKSKFNDGFKMLSNKTQIITSFEFTTSDGKTENTLNLFWWSSETRGSYSVLNDLILSKEVPDPLKSVTLTTQGTFEFLYHIENICTRWDGYISVGVYAPGDDFVLAIKLIYYLRKCKDDCIKSRTSWHFVYDKAFGPKDNQLYSQNFVQDILLDMNCSQSYQDIIAQFNGSFRANHSLPYPINVCRNVARVNAMTKYVLASDIELYPSDGFVPAFLQMVEREKSGFIPILLNSKRYVYVIPVFEVQTGVEPPRNKSVLRALMGTGKAIDFHKHFCDICHKFPDREKWVNFQPDGNSLGIFRVTQRKGSQRFWEPFYIGTNDEPLWNEELTWDGKRDKMTQAFEMCLMGYDFAVLDNAFLVHAPGIKHLPDPRVSNKKENPFIKKSSKIYTTILAKLRKKYGKKYDC